jgi:hypothetical protein
MKKTLSLMLVAMILVIGLGFAPAVFADDASTDVQAKGMGELTAQGDGIALLGGKGKVELSGNGILWIKDVAGDAKIDVQGYGNKKEYPDGWIQYSGLHGNADIKGSNLRIVIAGTDVNLHAKGRGKIILWGHGTYEINGRPGQWSSPDTFPRPVTIAQ